MVGSLLDAAADFARVEGAIRLTLPTSANNEAAQRLYTARGWIRETEFLEYNLAL